MEFGFSLPSRGPAATMQNLRTLAQHAESLGLDSVCLTTPDVTDMQRVMARFAQEVKPAMRS